MNNDRILAKDIPSFVRVTKQEWENYLVEFVRYADNNPPTPAPYEVTFRAKCNHEEDAMFFAKAAASVYRVDIEYVPFVRSA